MSFDQTLKLNETWRELAWGPAKDDSAEKHLVRPLTPSTPTGLTAAWPHAAGPGVFPPSSWKPSKFTFLDLNQLIHLVRLMPDLL